MTVYADLHVHSIHSYDGRSTLDALARSAKEKGLHAIAIADHDVFTDVSGKYPVLLIPAMEITTTGGHILGLFLKTEPFSSSVATVTPSAEEAISEIRRCGGLAVIAHPFCPQKLTEQELVLLQADGVEAENARSAAVDRKTCKKAAQLPARFYTGGSDAHCAEELGGCISRIECDELTLDSVKQSIENGRITPEFHHACRWKYKGFSQWQKRRNSPLPQRLKALTYLTLCVLRDAFTRR